MSWWGKVVGGTFGFMLGGPLGALMGASLGNYFDGGAAGGRRGPSLGLGDTERVQSVFFSTTFALMGYIAKADGEVSKAEIALTEQVIQQMKLGAVQRKVAIKLFNEGKKDGFPVHEVLAQFKHECYRRRSLIQKFLEIVTATAFADGCMHANEQRILEGIASDLGYSKARYAQLLSRLSGQAHFASDESIEDRLSAAYGLLAISPGASAGELKKAYRRQMNQHHPDKLVAKGLPEEMIDLATKKAQDIKAAYELIKLHRK
jgi:DnaJ like chaperone protein